MGKAFHIGALTALLIGISSAADEPFGVVTTPVPSSGLSAIWQAMQPDMRADEQTVIRCRADPSCGSSTALRFIAIVDEAKQYQGRGLLGHINRSINLAVVATRTGDIPWMSPLTALAVPGDCKSYAMAKYAALGDAGIAPEDRRLVVVWDRTRPDTHLVVIVREAGRWLILDNRTMLLLDTEAPHPYQPLHMLDHSGARTFPAVAPVGGPL